MSQEHERELLELIRSRSYRRGRFRLSSGKESDHYFNLKPTMMHPRGAYLAAKAFMDRVRAENVTLIGGLEMGAVPILGALAAVSEFEGAPIDTFFVRKEPKAHGTKDKIEGLGLEESLHGRRVLVADDVATSGGSIMKAVEPIREAGGIVDVALVLLDRNEGATEYLHGHGIRLASVFRSDQFSD
jgi:orotate phosphoribosyltransferase